MDIFAYIPNLVLFFSVLLGVFFAFNSYTSYNRKKNECFNDRTFHMIELLNFFYIKDIFFETIKLCSLFVSIMGLFLIWRINDYVRIYNIWGLSMTNNNNFLNFLCFMLIIIFLYLYLLALNTLLKYSFYKIHLYLLQYDYYYEFSYIIRNKYLNSLNFSSYVALQVIISYCLDQEDSFFINSFKDTKEKTLYIKAILYMRNIINSDIYLKSKTIAFLKLLEKYRNFISFEQAIFEYFPHILLFCGLFYDLRNNEIKYFYYFSLMFMAVILYRKYREFIGQTDLLELDSKLAMYFYKEKSHEKLLIVKTEDLYKAILYAHEIAYEIYSLEKELRTYFEKEYIIFYIEKNFRLSYKPWNFRLIFLGIFILYVNYCYPKLTLWNNLIIGMLLFLSYLLCEYNHKNQKIKYNIIYNIFCILGIMIAINIFLWIYLTRKTS